MASVGPGVREIRIRDAGGAFRILHVTDLPEAVYVLHAFEKKAERTPQHDLELAAARLRSMRR